jgi:hypothetical protein
MGYTVVFDYDMERPMETCKATIVVGDSTMTFEGSPDFVQAQVDRFSRSQPTQALFGHNTPRTENASLGPMEMQLVTEKRPRGHHEIATVLAFALSESGVKEFTEEEIRRAYIRAGVRPPKFVAQALRDAKSKFDYIATGSKRGTYRLTNHGDSTVRFDLPRSAG